MRKVYYDVAVHLKTGREKALEGDRDGALGQFSTALKALHQLPPERTRDILLAHAYLNRYQTLALENRDVALESLHLGVSYARSTRDPIARAIAEQCIAGLDIAL
jgi:hypothetical protein